MSDAETQARLKGLLEHPDLVFVRQGVELHRSLFGKLPEVLWVHWQARELYSWLMAYRNTLTADRPLRLEVCTPGQLHRVCMGIAEYTALSRLCRMISATTTARSATVSFGYFFDPSQPGGISHKAVTFLIDEGRLSWSFEDCPRKR